MPSLRNSLLLQLLLAKHTETLVELVDTTAGINYFLGASVEWVTSTTHVQVQVFTYSRVDFDNVTTSTGGSDLGVFRMDTWFHRDYLKVKAMSLFQPEVGHHMQLITSMLGRRMVQDIANSDKQIIGACGGAYSCSRASNACLASLVSG